MRGKKGGGIGILYEKRGFMAIGRSSKPRFILLRVKRSLEVQDMMDIHRKREKKENPIQFLSLTARIRKFQFRTESYLLFYTSCLTEVREKLLESKLISFTCDFFSTSCSISLVSSFMSALFFCDTFSEFILNFVWQDRLKQSWDNKRNKTKRLV